MDDLLLLGDEKLMQELRAGNMLAFDVIYNKYCKRIYKFGFSILKSQEEAENLIQDVYLKLWENRNTVEKGSSLKYYLFTIAYNSAITIIRKKARENKFVEYLKSLQESCEGNVNVEVEYNELTNKLNEIVSELPARQKEIYLLHKVEGLKYSEIAERLDISVNTIENHMSRALKTIRKKLGGYSLISLLLYFLFI